MRDKTHFIHLRETVRFTVVNANEFREYVSIYFRGQL